MQIGALAPQAFRFVAASPFPARAVGEPGFAVRPKRCESASLPIRQAPPTLVARTRSRQVWLLKPCIPSSAPGPIRDQGEEIGDKPRQNQGRGESVDSIRETQLRSARGPAPSRGMVAKELNRDAGGTQSIIAALRMQTIVARAGFALRLRIRWGISHR